LLRSTWPSTENSHQKYSEVFLPIGGAVPTYLNWGRDANHCLLRFVRRSRHWLRLEGISDGFVGEAETCV
jgi:hypothetical protein